MAENSDVFIVSGVRTPVGAFGGALATLPPTELAATCVREAIIRAHIRPEDIEHVVFGHVINTEPKDMYMARVAAINAGVPTHATALTVNRLCSSGVQAIVSAMQSIRSGDADIAVAGGAESMSRAPHILTVRSGVKHGATSAIDMMTGALTDPFGSGHMGITAENVAERHNISRLDQDELALQSQQRAVAAIQARRFQDEIVPVSVQARGATRVIDTDEYPKPDTTLEGLAKLRPVFKKDGTVTAGNASGLNDGAGALILMSGKAVVDRNAKPVARILGYAFAGVDPSEMGIGPVPAVTRLLRQTGLKIADFDVVESNEAFAAQACAVARKLELDPEKTNPNGGAIALGHPIGATGAIITVKCMYELQRTSGRRGLVTMCIGGGQGVALAIEAIH